MSRHSEAARTVDTLMVLGLTGLLLVGFDATFADRSYLFGSIAGLLAVVAIVLVVDYYDKEAGLLLLCALPTYVLLGATVGVRNSEAYVRAPTPDALVGVLSASIAAVNELLTTIPPVDAVGDATMVPYAVAFLVGGAALWAAVRSSRPAAPVVPVLIGLAITVLLGTHERELLVLRSAVLSGACLAWLAVRGARRRTVASGERGRTARMVAAAVLVGGLAASAHLLLPAVRNSDPERVVLRGRIGAGHDVADLTTPLSSFRRFTRQPLSTSTGNVHDERILRVRGLPPNHTVRFVALDVYDGRVWHADNRTMADANDDLYLRIGSEVGAPRHGRAVEAQVQVLPTYLSDWLPLPGQLTEITFDYRDGRAQRADVRYDPATVSAVVIGGLDAGDDYHAQAVVAGSRLRPRAEAYASDGPLQQAGAFLDAALRPWTESALTPMGRVRSLARYVRTNGRYSSGADPAERRYTAGHDEARLGREFFLARQIVGDQEQYAGFMALAANRLGVPARVVVGATPGPRGWVEGKDVSAWIEVRVADGTWRTMPTEDFMGRRPPKRNDPPRELPSQYLDQQQPDDEEAEAEQATKPQDGKTDETTRGSEGSSTAPLAWWLPVLSLVVWAVPLAKLVRRRRRALVGPASARIVGAWRELLDLARDLGQAIPPGLGRAEQGARLGLDPTLAVTAQTALFARDRPADGQAKAFWAQVHEQRREMRRRVGPLRRAWAPWNPASLVPRRSRPRKSAG